MGYPNRLKKSIFTPGPCEVPEAVLTSIISHKIHHRSTEFKSLYKELISKLKKIFLTEHDLLVLTSSGTGAMEAAVLNFCAPSDRILFVNTGKFGKRWGDICRVYGIQSDEVYVEPGYGLQTDNLKDLEIEKYYAVFLTHSETSTATLTDVKTASQFIHANSDALVVVDGITSVGAIEFRMDGWGIDVVISASQKGFMCPPGLAMIAFNEKAKLRIYKSDFARYYFDLRTELEASEKNLTSWTPSIALFYGLNTAAEIILEGGLENWWNNTSACAEYFRNEMSKSGLEIFSHQPVDSLTALYMPEGINSELLIDRLHNKYGVFIANGQEKLWNKIIRVSHMGDLELSDFEELAKVIDVEIKDIIARK